MSQPLIIVTPIALRLAQWFAHTAQSINHLLSQTPVHWVVVLDGPGSIETLKAIIAPNLAANTTFLTSSGGVAPARDKALQYVKEEFADSWITFLDGDDLIDDDGVVEVLDLISGLDENISWVGTSRKYFGELDERPQHIVRPEAVGVCLAPDGLKWTRPDTFHPNSFFFHARCLQEVSYPTKYNFNEDMYFRFLLTSIYDGYITDTVTTLYRIWDNQSMAPSGKYYAGKMERLMTILDELNEFRAQHGYGKMGHPY